MKKEAKLAPWLKSPKMKLARSPGYDGAFSADVIVVGAGIAGASAAFEFAEAGLSVLVLERESQEASLGSGNLQGMLYLKLSPNLTYQNDLVVLGFKKTLAILKLLTERGLLRKGDDWDSPGLLQLQTSQKVGDNQAKLTNLYSDKLLYKVDQQTASQLAGVSLTSGGLFFPTSGWVSPPALVKALLTHSKITLKTDVHVIDMDKMVEGQDFDCMSYWRVKAKDEQQFFGQIVILAMADKVTELRICEDIPFTVVRGQTTTVKAASNLSIVVSGEGYVAPSKRVDGQMVTTFGATFHRDQSGGNPTISEHLENIAMLKQNSPELVEQLGIGDLEDGRDVQILASLEGRAATRASAMGSLPIVGPIANRSLFLERFSAIRLDSKAIPDMPVPWELGVYLTTAHGSRGMITAPVAAEILRRYVLEDIDEAYFSSELLGAIHPNRFFYRELRFDH